MKENILEQIKDNMIDDVTIYDMSNIFKILGDPTRIKILYALEQKELCVNEICECINMNKSAVSHQLSTLKQAKLVKGRKQGKEVYYALDDEHVSQMFDCALEHVTE